MAIIIPSKKIYETQNPKVIENAIKKIDVEYLKTDIVYTDTDTDDLEQILDWKDVEPSEIITSEAYQRIFPETQTDYMFGAGLKIDSTSIKTGTSLQRLQKNYYITEISPILEIIFDVTISTVKAVSYLGVIPDGYKRFDFTLNNQPAYNSRETTSSNFEFSTSNVKYDYTKNFKIQDVISILPEKISAEFSVIDTNKTSDDEDQLTSKISLTKINSAINSAYPYKIEKEYTEDTFELDIEFINKFTVWFAQDHALASQKDKSFGRPVEATKIEFVAKSAKIVYNETIKYLNIEGKTQTLTSESTNGEAIFSISQNPFIRADNKYLNNSAIETFYRQTLNKYIRGKETAKVRCSIGEYFDENGNLVISTKTPDKMLFEHYDKVVPLVKVGKRQELAMSYTADGLAKVFDIVGVRVFFDGAVWQELTLRESGEGIDIGRTTYTTIANNAGGLTYKITSNEIVTEENSAGGITYIIGD